MTSVVSLYLSRRRRDEVRTSFAIRMTIRTSSRDYRRRLFTTRTHARAIPRDACPLESRSAILTRRTPSERSFCRVEDRLINGWLRLVETSSTMSRGGDDYRMSICDKRRPDERETRIGGVELAVQQ